MKIYLNRAPHNGPWGGGNMFVQAMYEELVPEDEDEKTEHELCHPMDSTAVPDVILLAGLSNEGPCISAEQAVYYKMFNRPQTKLILRVNENDARKDTSDVDDILVKLSEYIDGTVFVSDWLRDYFLSRGWQCKNTTVIHNGVDGDVFKPGEKLDNGLVNIVTHHWSNNYMKGFDFYDKIDAFINENPEFSFTYIGRERGSFSRKTKIIRPIAGQKLAEELGKYDVYVSASRFDPGPNHILESLACGLPTYVYRDGGGCVEFAGRDHVFNDWSELETLLLSKKFDANEQFKPPSWKQCVDEYVDYMKNLTI